VNAVAIQVPPPVRAEDVEEQRLVEVDTEFLEYFGPDFASWKPWQVENYVNAIAAAHAEFSSEAVAS
jgi:hypothetical protein